jgi:hypothetical protein
MWLKQEISLYKTHADNTGRAATFEEIFFWGFGPSLKVICELRRLDRAASDYLNKKRELKNKLQCYTPAALLQSKARDGFKLIKTTGVMQFDFDYADIAQYDIEELKRAVFALPFIAYCGLSCSGDGFYALALIAEPERLTEYAEHCFKVFEGYGIKADTSKGKKIENLRYVSYDANMLVKEDPKPLLIKKFIKPAINKGAIAKARVNTTNNEFVKKQLSELISVMPGQRMLTIQKIAFTLGGKQNENYLHEIKSIIYANELFADDTKAYIRCAEDCFRRGSMQPI